MFFNANSYILYNILHIILHYNKLLYICQKLYHIINIMKLKEIGLRIKSRREVLKINQFDLAKLVNISRSTLSKIENGEANMSIETLLEICNKLNLELNINVKR